MRSDGRASWPSIAFLAAAAVVFSPGVDDVSAGRSGPTRSEMESRVLAPTVREAVPSVGPRVSARWLHVDEHGSGNGPAPLASALAAAVAALLAVLTASVPPGPMTAPRLAASHTRAPRGPPLPTI